MNPTAPAAAALLQTVWLQTFWNYINACIQSGKDYQPHEQNNIAVHAVYLADSAKQAYLERFGGAVPQSGGGVAPQASQQSNELFERLDTPQTRPSVVAQMDQAVSKMQAASHHAAQFKPARPRVPS